MFEKGIIKYDIQNKDGIYCYTTIRDLICIPYYDTEAGSNPREFQGMTITNIKILKSILDDPKRFWSKHLGIAITIKKGINSSDNKKLKYEDACITNGLQTLSIFRVLIMIKIYQEAKNKNEVHKKIPDKTIDKFKQSIFDRLKDEEEAEFFLTSIAIKQVNSLLNWLNKDVNINYLNKFQEITIDNLLDIKISFKAVILDELLGDDEYDELDTIPKWGDDIANANNETQNVKEDDKFGTKNTAWLEKNMLQEVNNISIEYRKFTSPKQELPVKHILEVLRAIIPTTLLIDCKCTEEVKYNIAGVISKYANNRAPVYSLFEKFISLSNSEKSNIEIKYCKDIMKSLTPYIVNTMLIFDKRVKKYYNNLTFKDVLGITNQTPESLKVRLRVDINENDEENLDKAIKKQLRFSPSNIFPIFIFSIRNSIIIDEKLAINYNVDDEMIDVMIDSIYRSVLKKRITTQYGSTSDLFRDPELYIQSYESFEMWSNKKYKIDYLQSYRINLSEY